MTHKIIVSVPHTGTRFLQKRFGIAHHVHTHSNWVKIMNEIQDRQIVSPLRHPKDVWRSWCRRRHADDLTNWVSQFFIAWGNLHTLDQMYDIDFVCVDKGEDSRITDWQKVGDTDGDSAQWKLHKVDLRPLMKLPMIQRNYSSWHR